MSTSQSADEGRVVPHRSVILAVDDNAPLCRVYEQALGLAGYLVLVASDGATALDIAAEFADTIDLLLVDLHLPDMSGPTFARRARLSVPVLFVSGHDLAIARLRWSGPFDILPKPFGIDELRARVAALCGGRGGVPGSPPDPAA